MVVSFVETDGEPDLDISLDIKAAKSILKIVSAVLRRKE